MQGCRCDNFQYFLTQLGSRLDNLSVLVQGKTESSQCQLCYHWWHRRLSLWQPPVTPVTTTLSFWQISVSKGITFDYCLHGRSLQQTVVTYMLTENHWVFIVHPVVHITIINPTHSLTPYHHDILTQEYMYLNAKNTKGAVKASQESPRVAVLQPSLLSQWQNLTRTL